MLAALLRNVIIGLLASLMTAVAMGKSGVRWSRHRCHDARAIMTGGIAGSPQDEAIANDKLRGLKQWLLSAPLGG